MIDATLHVLQVTSGIRVLILAVPLLMAIRFRVWRVWIALAWIAAVSIMSIAGVERETLGVMSTVSALLTAFGALRIIELERVLRRVQGDPDRGT